MNRRDFTKLVGLSSLLVGCDYVRWGLDNATTAAAGTMIDRAKRSVITAEYKINLVAPSTGDRLTCHATVVKPGRTLTVVEAKVFCRIDGDEKLVAVALATIANLDTKTPQA